MKGASTFRNILLTIFAVVLFYFWKSLLSPLDTGSPEQILFGVWLLIVVALILVPPLFFWTSSNRGESKASIRMQLICNQMQDYFSYLLMLTVLRDLAFGVQLVAGQQWLSYSPLETELIFGLPFVFQILGRAPIVLGPFVKATMMPLEKLPNELEGFKIAQISDLHIGPGIPMSRIQKVIELTNKQMPDIICLTGDIVDHLDKWFMNEINMLGQLRARYGVYYIAGNHEYYWGYHPIVEKMRRLGFHVLENKSSLMQFNGKTVAICGVTDFAASRFDMEAPDLKKAAAGTDAAALKILLAHQPKIADAAAKAGFDVQLSGHTHAGQFIPWSLMIKLFQKYPKGHYRVGRMRLYVNQGTGHWGPADRLGTMPEISVLTLRQAAPLR